MPVRTYSKASRGHPLIPPATAIESPTLSEREEHYAGLQSQWRVRMNNHQDLLDYKAVL